MFISTAAVFLPYTKCRVGPCLDGLGLLLESTAREETLHLIIRMLVAKLLLLSIATVNFQVQFSCAHMIIIIMHFAMQHYLNPELFSSYGYFRLNPRMCEMLSY